MSKLTKFQRGSKKIHYKITEITDQGEVDTDIKCPEAPTPECDAALQKLVGAVKFIMEVPDRWIGPDDARTVVITGIDVSHTAAGTKSIVIHFTKGFNIQKRESYKTPMVQFDEPQEGEQERCPLTEEHQCDCRAFYGHAIAYVGGVRQQATLEGIHNARIPHIEEEDPNQTKMPLADEPDAEPGETQSESAAE